MPTSNPRINITLEPNLLEVVNELAEHEHKSLSSLSKELIIEALTRREDMALSTLAKARDIETESSVDHDDAWK